MNRFLLLPLLLLTVFYSKAQYVNIPDANFRNFLLTNYPSCFNGAQMLDTTCSGIVNEVSLSPLVSIANWDGLQYFDNLQELGLYGIGAPSVLPATLKKLIYPYATTLPPLPNGLLYLELRYCSFALWPVLPNSLEHLECIEGNLPNPVSYPSSLKYFNCSDGNITSLGTLPAALDTLICHSNYGLTSLPPLPSTLKVLDCSGNYYMTAIPSLPAGLNSLNVGGDAISSLPALPSSLEFLNAVNNDLTSLPVPLPGSLKTLNVAQNSISSLPALPATLRELECWTNQISILPALPANLQTLNCNDNQIAIIPTLPAGLRYFTCNINQVISIPVLPAGLETFGCNSNQISILPSLPQSLLDFGCSFNLLTSLPSLPPALRTLNCYGNQLTSIPPLPAFIERLNCGSNPIYFLPALPSGYLTNIDIQQCPNLNCMPVLPQTPGLEIQMDNIINCIPNAPANIDMYCYDPVTGDVTFGGPASPYFPICSAVNNRYHCNAFPRIKGQVYYDNNNNAIHDANEPVRANVKIGLSDGTCTYTDNAGFYQITTGGSGFYTIDVEAPLFFAATPLQYNFNFNSNDTLVTGNDFAFHDSGSADSISLSIIPLNVATRPGFSYPYMIIYTNEGTTTLNGTVIFNYDNTRLAYDSSSNASVINTGNSLTLTDPGLVPGTQKYFIGYFRINPTAVNGDSLRSGAHITTGTVAAHDSDVVAIRGSFDPNDKSATPELSTAQVAGGEYIYYTIRFQNTGTDTAFTVVVTDTLDSRLQVQTLQMIATSHPCITTVKGNTISFEFINILLPDSNVNQLKSHGYISFRIKPVNTLVVNDIVPNKASIYFDYNSPVVTNSATTIIINPIVVPLKLLSFTASRGIGLNANLYWQTNDEVNVKNYTIEMSTNGRSYTAVGFENAKGFQYNSYSKTIPIPSNSILYFRLKMTDIDGRYTYSIIAILRNHNDSDAFSFLNNPVKDELSISLMDERLKNSTATIFSAQGVKLRTIQLQNDIENINIKSLPTGTYYLQTVRGSKQFVVLK